MKQLIHCVIIDDEPLAVQLVEDYAKKITSLKVLYAGSNVYEAIQIVNTHPVDLIFLDIQMPELTGIEVMQLFNREHNFIITSAYPEYALDAFQFHVVDFILKPITFNRFYQSVEKFTRWQETFRVSSQPDHLFVRADRKHYKIAFEDILYIEGLRDYIRIHTKNEKIMVLDNMKDILGKLPSDQFIRIHRSYIIPTDKIKLIEGNQIQLHNQEFVPIGETYRKVVSEWLEGK
ncbi:response regulator transcription factor [Crocinitomicaceae bacterium CZZ-1]|uniref:Response regulator transcription factor n=1 Tax=Taishania pollutisoli TaxID=2766479 RepID=A0A8J6P5E4_9FLAO|nr:LytTR family DNA-binding domain-containing protein [Taishania pollutisoli]MBC9812122.1 response regulator transcription factor [Taishania pollutisoli]MBX2949803.1 response regulator transcription factor [Crocinitomicaceae bacterium]